MGNLHGKIYFGSFSPKRKITTSKINPLDQEYIVEKIFSFLDSYSIKRARKVCKLWSAVGAKVFITKCVVRIPSVRPGTSCASVTNTMDKFAAFLSYKSNLVLMAPNICVRAPINYNQWEYLKNLGNSVKFLQLNIFEDNCAMFHLLDILPNLEYLSFEEMDHRVFSRSKDRIVFVLLMVMLQDKNRNPDRNREPLVISKMNFSASNLGELDDIKRLSDFNLLIHQKLKFSIRRQQFLLPFTEYEIKVLETLRKFLNTSGSILWSLTLQFCEAYLFLLKFPCMPKLTSLDLYFGPQTMDLDHHYKFSSTFRFSENLPKLWEITIEYDGAGRGQGQNFLDNLLEKSGTALTVKQVKFSDNFFDCTIDPLFRIFPNLQHLEAARTGCSKRMMQSIFIHGKNLTSLRLRIYLNQMGEKVEDLDSIFTGFDQETVNRIKNGEKLTDKALKKLRVNPSILDLKKLTSLTISFYGDAQVNLPERMLAITGQYAFMPKLMPKGASIFIRTENFKPMQQNLVDSLCEISKLSNVYVWGVIKPFSHF